MKRIILTIVAVAVLAVPSLASAHVSSLSMSQARHAAANRAWSFHPDGGVNSVKSSWCNRWSRWQIDCGAEADGSVYNYELDWDESTWCMATVDVFKNPRTGRITTRLEQDMSCYGV
jgi:Ni/Co efflux regulator RcnB